MKLLIICTGWGSWVKPFVKELSRCEGIEVYTMFVYHESSDDDNLQTINLDLSPRELHGHLSEETFLKYNNIIREIHPDIIQVFGTENNFGQLTKYIKDIPVVVHVQGFLSCCAVFQDSFIHEKDLKKYRSLKNYFGFGGSSVERQVKQNGDAELDILKNNIYFYGRTAWDRNVLYYLNKKAQYFIGEELLREPFYENVGSWNIDSIEKHSLFMPSGFNPIKGMHIALEALYLLKRDYPDIKIYIPGLDGKFILGSKVWRYIRGEAYTNYLSHLITKYSLEKHIVLTGRLNAEEMVHRMKRTHVFLSPSVIDNSPNAVGEATMIGVPIVTTYVGGIPSFLEDGKDCLFANSGDPYMIAAAIDKIFKDDALAKTLSSHAVMTARKRHDKKMALEQYVKAYQKITYDFKKI